MKTTYKQCELMFMPTYDMPNPLSKRVMVEWVPSKLASAGKLVTCQNQLWQIIHVGQECDDPRDAHDCRT